MSVTGHLVVSPHLASFKRFYENLPGNLRIWLNDILLSLEQENKLTFKPESTVQELPDFAHPLPDDVLSAKNRGNSLSSALNLKVSLSADQGTWDWPIGLLYNMTSHGSFVHNGHERFPIAQFSKSPGVFFRHEERYKLRFFGPDDLRKVRVRYAIAEVRPLEGVHLSFELERKPNSISPIRVVFPGGLTAKLGTLLDALGFTDKNLDDIFTGKDDLLEAVKIDRDNAITKKDVNHIARRMGLGKWLNETKASIDTKREDDIRSKVKEKYESSVLGRLGRGQVNRRIRRIDAGYKEEALTITQGDIAGILKAYLSFANDGFIADDPWDLGNMKVRLVGDYLDTAFTIWEKWMRRRINTHVALWMQINDEERIGPEALRAIIIDANIEEAGATYFNKLMKEWLIDSPMAQIVTNDEHNPVEVASLTRKISYNGWGGIPIGHDRLPRDFHWSHFGRLCPLDTPQSNDVGISLSMALGARVNDMGLLEASCRKVTGDDNGNVVIANEDDWVSPWDEVETKGNGWVAFPDQWDDLLRGKPVSAHKAWLRRESKHMDQIGFIHSSEEGMFSLAANLLPYRKHNDPTRSVMACGFLKQALPLKDMRLPAKATGYETTFASNYTSIVGNGNTPVFGTELLVGYLAWKGWNFEDAIVISESAANSLTDVTVKKLLVKLRRSINEQKTAFKTNKKNLQKEMGIDLDKYDDCGIIKQGSVVSTGDHLALEPSGKATKKATSKFDHQWISHKIEKNIHGFVTSVNLLSKDGESALYQIVVENTSKAEIGDKLANRHGHKGVISKVHKDVEMPYIVLASERSHECQCGEKRNHRHLEILLNPLGVISRMNIGQLIETVEARNNELKGLPERIDCFDPSKKLDERKLKNQVLVGRQFVMKLDHNADDKVHARSREPKAYNSFVEQPLKGKRLEGGQRLGEMEVWALMAHNASGILREMLTLKSDNPLERKLLYYSLLGMINEPDTNIPEAARTLAAFCYGLGLTLKLGKSDGTVIDPLIESCSPDAVVNMSLMLLDEVVFKNVLSHGEIKTPIKGGGNKKFAFATDGQSFGQAGDGEAVDVAGQEFTCAYHPEGLESEQIFGPVKDFTCACGKYSRKVIDPALPLEICEICWTPLLPASHRRARMGHIVLARPVPNPFLFYLADADLHSILGLNHASCRSLMEDRPRISFTGKGQWDDAVRFLGLSCDASAELKGMLEKQIEENISADETVEDDRLSREASQEELVNSPYFKLIEKLKGPSALAGLVNKLIQEHKINGIDFLSDLLQKAKPELCLTILPVIPPKLRSRFEISNGNYKPHDLTELYTAVLRANVALRDVYEGKEDWDEERKQNYIRRRRELQHAVEQLYCNQKLSPRLRARDWGAPGKPVRYSISSYLEGKEGLLVGHLLGKRVDFSGRAVIVPNPDLPIDECRIPVRLAVKLFFPHLIAAMPGKKAAIQQAIAKGGPIGKEVLARLELIILENGILLNRQPTLHSLGMLAFKAQLGKGSVIQIPPLVTKGFNADFDGDQMAVYLPLTHQGKADVQEMYPSNHLWRPLDGKLALNITQDILLGGYLDKKTPAKTSLEIETYAKESLTAATNHGASFSHKDLCEISDTSAVSGSVKESLNSAKIPLTDVLASGARGNWDTMTYIAGRKYPEREKSNLAYGLNIGELFEQAFFGRKNLVDTKLGTAEGGALTKDMVSLAHNLWISEEDCKDDIGIPVSAGDEYWILVENMTSAQLKALFEKYEPKEITQLLVDITGRSKKFALWPMKTTSLEKLGSLFVDHPTRIPPRLIGICIKKMRAEADPEKLMDLLFLRIYGRVLVKATEYTLDAKATEEVIDKIINQGETLYLRSPLTCKSTSGICRRCYGMPITEGREVRGGADKFASLDTRAGIIAAQAVSEPGTQMALRKKHLVGAAAGSADYDMGIREAKKCLGGDSPFTLNAPADSTVSVLDVLLAEENRHILRSTLDHIYRENNINIASIHFETLFAGFLRKYEPQVLLRARERVRTTDVIQNKDEGSLSADTVDPMTKDVIGDAGQDAEEDLRSDPASDGQETGSQRNSADGNTGWIAAAAHPDVFKGESALTVIAHAALENVTDKMNGLKEHVLIGRSLPESKKAEVKNVR